MLRRLPHGLLLAAVAACGPLASPAPPGKGSAGGTPTAGDSPTGGPLVRIGAPAFHSGPARKVAYVAPGKVMVVSPEERLSLWDEDSGRLLGELQAPGPQAEPAVAADGKRVVWIRRDERGARLQVVAFPGGAVVAERPIVDDRFDTDLRPYLLAGGRVALTTVDEDDGTGCVQLYDARLEPQQQVCPDGEFDDLVPSPDGKHLAVFPAPVDPAPILRILALPGGELEHDVPVRRSVFLTVVFAPDGGLLAIAEGDDIRVLRTAGWTEALRTTVDGQRQLALAFDAGSRVLAAGDGDRVTTVALSGGRTVGELELEPRGVEPATFALSPGGSRLAYVRHGGLFRANTDSSFASPLPDFHVIESAALAPDGGTLAFTDNQDNLCFHDARDGRQLRCTWIDTLGRDLAFLPDSRAVVAVVRDDLLVIPVDGRGETRRIPAAALAAPTDADADDDGYDDDTGTRTVTAFTLAPDGSLVAVAVQDDAAIAVLLVDLASGALRHRFTVPIRGTDVRWVDGVIFRSDGKQVAFAVPTRTGSNTTVHTYDVATGAEQELQVLRVMMPRWLAIAGDGTLLAGNNTEIDLRGPGAETARIGMLRLVADDGRHAVLADGERLLLWPLDGAPTTARPLPPMTGTLHGIAPAACRALTCDDAQLCYVWETCKR